MYCTKCGKETAESKKFCGWCGAELHTSTETDTLPVPPAKISPTKKPINKKVVILVSVFGCIVVVLAALFAILKLTASNPLKKKIMENSWWTEIEFTNSYLDYKDIYFCSARCERYTFCPSGNVRHEKFSFGPAAYETTEKITADNIPTFFAFPEAISNNKDDWELVDKNTLVVDDVHYTWSDDAGRDTWYVDDDILRIGQTCFSANNPGVKVLSTADKIPYWCSFCGEEGPYSKKICSQCDGEDYIKCDWVIEQESAFFVQNAETICVDNFVGMSYAGEVVVHPNIGNYTVKEPQTGYNDDYPAGYVYKQEPAAGSTVRMKGDLILYVSMGSRLAEVPAITPGESATMVGSRLKAEGFRVKTVEESHQEIAKGAVIRLSPEPGAKVKYGSEVTMFVSSGINGETYTVTVVDEHGTPIPNALVQICSDSCYPARTDKNGIASWVLEKAKYTVSFLTLPAGYTYSSAETESSFDDNETSKTIILKRTS